MSPVRIAVLPPLGAGVSSNPDWIRGFARHAESLGFESIVLAEHPLVISSYASRYPYARSGRMPLANDCPVPDPLDLLAFLAGCTTTLGLSTGVLILPAHHPVILAKRLATIDALSGGRVRLGIGVGWMREELEACGAEFSSRGRRTDESIDVLRLLWADSGSEGASFSGEFFNFSNAHCFPKPVRRGGIPIHIGGHSPASVRRAALRGDGWHPLGVAGDELTEALSLLHEEASKAGRDPSSIEITLSTAVPVLSTETIEQAEAAGPARLVVAFLTGDLSEAKDQLSSTAELFGLEAAGPRVIPA
jgi:probable F420-dependent oxidoreductase